MPKNAPPPATPITLKGKSLSFVGKFTYPQTCHRDKWVKAAGAKVVMASTKPDIVVCGEGRGGKPPGDVAKILKRLPTVEVIAFDEFARRALPSPADLLARLTRSEPGYDFWDPFTMLAHYAGGNFDLGGTDFRGAKLRSAKLGQTFLSGCNFTDVDCRYAELSTVQPIENAKFDGAKLYAAHLHMVTGCSFRGADLDQTWANNATYENCDFRDADLSRVYGSNTTFTDCDFRGATFPDADLERATFVRCNFTGADLTRAHAHKSKFTDCALVGANLTRADLRETALKGADFRKANFTLAALGGADLTSANVAGADFTGAVLAGATVGGVDFKKAKNYVPPQVRTPGPAVKEFAGGATGAKSFSTSAEVEIGKGEFAELILDSCQLKGYRSLTGRSRYHRAPVASHDWIPGTTVAQALLNMADRWPSVTLRLDTVKASGSTTARGPKLQELAVAAWAEAFAVDADVADQKQAQRDDALADRDALMAKIRKKGTQVWRDLHYRDRDRLDLRGADLSGAKIPEIDLYSTKMQGAKFVGTDLTKARLWSGEFQGADFTGATLRKADLQYGKFERAVFLNAALNDANLQSTKLQGADFTGATLTGAKLDKAAFDEHTKFPAGFKVPDKMVWKGKGTRPGLKPVKAAAVGSLDFAGFLAQLPKRVDAGRMQKASAMLKAERFQLFADVTDAAVCGVVKSQSNKDLVYSCRLASDGAFGCGTQNLKPCGGQSGAVCKHLLVLVVGLAKAGKLDPATAAAWVAASNAHKPSLDAEALSATFLKYKGAEAGDVDWRPTETIPEDFYAM